MSKPLQNGLTIGLLCLISAAILSEANTRPSSYLIRPRPVRDFVGALVQLRTFLSNRFSQEQRCQRMAVLLSTMSKNPMNQFQIADIAVARKEEIAQRFYQINVEQLRNLYITASRQYLEQQHVDNSLIELLGCLKSGYRNRDGRARSFLNERELNTVIDQFQAISRQPLRLLIDGKTSQTDLNLHEFKDSMKNTVNNWIGDDRQRFDRLFKNPYEQPRQPARPEIFQPQQQAYARAGVGSTVAMPRVFPQQMPQLDLMVEEPSSEEVESSEEEDVEYLEVVFGSLMTIYESLPPQAQLADRCQAYSRVFKAPKEQVFSEGFLESLIKQVSARVLSQGPRRGVFRPDQSDRADFLFVVEVFDPLRAGSEVWLDLNECLSKWVNVDQEVARHLNSPEHVALVDQVSSQFEDDSALAYAQAGQAFY